MALGPVSCPAEVHCTTAAKWQIVKAGGHSSLSPLSFVPAYTEPLYQKRLLTA